MRKNAIRPALKLEARELRLQGMSLSKIRAALGNPCSIAALSIFLRDCKLSPEMIAANNRWPRHKSKNGWAAIATDIRRLMTFVSIQTDGCWLWNGPLWDQGYARIPRQGGTQVGHIVFYEHLVGPVAAGDAVGSYMSRPSNLFRSGNVSASPLRQPCSPEAGNLCR